MSGPSNASFRRCRFNLGPGSFRSTSRFWVDRNSRSRENLMRVALEELTGHPFPKIRPAFLRNPATNRCLELDAFCAALRLGAEFAGEQHRVFPNSCHSSRAEFDKQQHRDQLKLDFCRQHGVTLLIVPDSVKRNEMKEYVKMRLQELNQPHHSEAETEEIEQKQPFPAAARAADEKQ